MKIENILIVDDDPHQIQLIKIYLKNEKLNILSARNGRHALAVLKNEPVDIILTDNQMPEMNGETLTLKTRDDLKLKIPVIIISANETIQPVNKMINVSVLRKPFTSDQIKKTINAAY